MIPAFNISGVLPPFEGDNPAQPTGLSPYPTNMIEVVQRFGVTNERREILNGLLRYRSALRGIGLTSGFQWLDGSFCEDVEMLRGRPPGDVDVVTLIHRPDGIRSLEDLNNFLDQNEDLFDVEITKYLYKVDGYLIDLDTTPSLLVDNTVYWYGLFSHQRETSLWKGMLYLSLDPVEAGDDAAVELL